MDRQNILFDTNVIIEAHRAKCWNALKGQLPIETVEMCVQECMAGGPVTVDVKELRQAIKVSDVTDLELAKLALKLQNGPDLDAGEQHLLANAISREEDWILCSPDKALMRAMIRLDEKERLVSLEELVNEVGAKPRPALEIQFGKRWLEIKRTEFLMDEY